ncbi:MAG: BspA family leucine-rich repeat surface protein [Ketobacter sp.]|nr:BspA family leucine-rich repeat surface protein [Ketobacter sp.]
MQTPGGMTALEFGSKWVRPTDWLTMPTVLESEQKIVMLVAVYDHDSNFCAFNIAGNYTVDWGDGSALEDIASGVQAEHVFDYADLAGTESSRGYRQALIIITPQSGSNITAAAMSEQHSQALTSYYSATLDVVASCEFATTFVFYGSSSSTSLERFQFLSSGVTNATNMFRDCTSLQVVPLFDTSSVTYASNMFRGCTSLQVVPLFDTSGVTNATSMFYSCYSLQVVPLFDTSSVTDASNMFYSCYSLQVVPLFDTSSVTYASNMFYRCTSLQVAPLFDTSGVTNASNMFRDCYSLQVVPLFDTSGVTDATSMFYSCTSLQVVPLFDTSGVTNATSMFYRCYSLQVVPLFDTSGVTNATNMFYSCYSLAKAALSGTSIDIDYTGCKLAKTEIDEIFTNLATVVGKTITVTGNHGAATCDTSIATAKSWTVITA